MSTPQNLCLTPACLQASAQILWNMAPDYKRYDPCTQFEEMVCYGFRERNLDDRVAFTLGGSFNQRIEQILLESSYEFASNYTSSIKREEDPNAVDRANFQKIQLAYKTCMDETTIQKVGIAPFLEFVSEIGDIFPATDLNSTMTKDDYKKLQAATIFLETFGVSTFAELTILTNPLESDETILVLNPPATTLKNATKYGDKAAMTAYQSQLATLFKAIASAADSPLKVKDVESLATSVVNFEVELEKLKGSEDVIKENVGNVNGYASTLDELQKMAPTLDYKTILTGIAATVDHKDANMTTVNPWLPKLLSHIDDLVKTTPKATLQSWLVLRAVNKYGPFVSSTALAAFVGTADPGSDRAKYCVQNLENNLRFMIGRFYISSSFSSNKRNVASKMLTDIRSQFINRIQALDWMPAATKERAVKKVNNIQQNIGYPSSPGSELEMMDPIALADYYKTQNITNSFFANQLEFSKWQIANQVEKLGKPVDRGAFEEMALTTMNAYYQPRGNTIFIMAGIMQAPNFDDSLPWYANFGSLGAILGHELTHGFDNGGRLYNEEGEYKTWWDNTTVAEFDKRAQCFVGQYGNFSYEGPDGPIKVDGEQTLGENLADAGGLHTAYQAWLANRAALELSLPSLDMFTHEQLFFIFYANMWCSSYTPEYQMAAFPVDVHSAPSVRIRGTTENSRGFREAFNCPVKEPTCELW